MFLLFLVTTIIVESILLTVCWAPYYAIIARFRVRESELEGVALRHITERKRADGFVITPRPGSGAVLVRQQFHWTHLRGRGQSFALILSQDEGGEVRGRWGAPYMFSIMVALSLWTVYTIVMANFEPTQHEPITPHALIGMAGLALIGGGGAFAMLALIARFMVSQALETLRELGHDAAGSSESAPPDSSAGEGGEALAVSASAQSDTRAR